MIGLHSIVTDPAILKRYTKFLGGKSVFLAGPILSSGITQSSKILPSLTTLQFQFTKSEKAVQVTHPAALDGTFFLQIEEACLFIKR